MEVHNCPSIPITLAVLVVFGVFLTYITSVGLGHVYHFLPFLSDMSTFPPETCVFSFFMNLCAVIMTICLWIRNEQVENHVTSNYYPIRSVLLTVNNLNKWFMLSAHIGFWLLINFYVSGCFLLHGVGAGLFFYSVGFYLALDTFIAYHTTLSTRRRAHFKLGLVLNHLTLAGTSGNALMMVYFRFPGEKFEDFPLIKPEDDGYVFHTIAAIAQWMMILNITVYLFMLSKDFQGLSIKLPKVCSETTVNKAENKQD